MADAQREEASPSLLLDRAAARVAAAVRRAVHGDGLSLEKWRVLQLLAGREGATMTEIAGAVLVTGPTLTRLVDDLATRALVYREVDVHDRRRVLVHLAPRGRRMHRSLLPAVADAEREALAVLSDDERSALSDLLARLVTESVVDTTAARD